MKPSIRRRLLVTLLSVTTLLWLFTIVSSYRESQHEVEELFDAQLAQSARTLLTVAGHELAELEGVPESAHIHFLPRALSDDERHDYEHKIAYQLWLQPQKRLLVRSFSAPDSPLSPKLGGYSTTVIEHEPWRIFSLYDRESGFQVQVGESLAIRRELGSEITMHLALPMLIALPLLALLIYLGIGRALSPLRQVARDIARRQPGHLQPVEATGVPQEITPLVDALNRLFARVGHSLESERRFTADAAHELRTPLAALKVQLQVAQASQDEAERTRAIGQVVHGVERASRLVEQLLLLARLDPQSGLYPLTPLDLRPIAEETLADLEADARTKGVTLELEGDVTVPLQGQREGLTILLRNLVDNAIRYTPQGGRVAVSVRHGTEGTILHVDDSGPGLPEGERENVLRRFYRLAGQQTAGSGLGLSIVQRIAELHHAAMSLRQSPLGGLEVELRFPAKNG